MGLRPGQKNALLRVVLRDLDRTLTAAAANALRDRIGTELLFPVYRSPIIGSGSGAKYNIIGWVGFIPTSFTAGGSTGTIRGYFTKVIWQGLADETGTVPDFGVRVITLVE